MVFYFVSWWSPDFGSCHRWFRRKREAVAHARKMIPDSLSTVECVRVSAAGKGAILALLNVIPGDNLPHWHNGVRGHDVDFGVNIHSASLRNAPGAE